MSIQWIDVPGDECVSVVVTNDDGIITRILTQNLPYEQLEQWHAEFGWAGIQSSNVSVVDDEGVWFALEELV